MRVIEQDMIRAIRLRKAMRKGNTAVTHQNGECRVTLHGHLIGIVHDDGTVRFTLAGWNTPTTRSRVNALLRELCVPGYGVTTRLGQPQVFRVLDTRVNHFENIDSDAWVTISADGCLAAIGAAKEVM